MSTLQCRLCGAPVRDTVMDLGLSPLANSYVSLAEASHGEEFLPLHARVCRVCFLVQLEALAAPERLFSDYAYFSSYSDSWLEHARRFAEERIAAQLLNGQSRVFEVASNDGYLLRFFRDAGIPVLGIEPARNVAQAALAAGIPTEVEFLGEASAVALGERHGRADLLVANNVLAHVPRLDDFVAGLARLLAPEGVLSLEFPHLLRLIEETQFDTIYHEHFSYFSLRTASEALARKGLRAYDVQELGTHGGSLRILGCHADAAGYAPTARLRELLERENTAGLNELSTYQAFAKRALRVKSQLLRFLLAAAEAGQRVAGYGAPAKGNTLLNYCGLRSDLLPFTVDRSPHKQGMLLPGTRIPVHAPERIAQEKPDYLLILPWNLKQEVMEQMAHIRGWGGRFVVPIPELQVLT